MSGYKLNACLCCGSDSLECTIDFGKQPLANSYSQEMISDPKTYPLALNLCKNCWHSQLSYCADRNEIFDSYLYVSGTSSTLNSYFKWFASEISKALGPNSSVLEIAANDGTLIKELGKYNLNCQGIDPAKNIVDKAKEDLLPIECGYWPANSDFVQGNFDSIICINVLAHVDNPKEFLAECKNRLNMTGFIVIQPSQAKIFKNCEFDTLYHEHISFFNINSIKYIADSVGLELVASSLVNIHGDSPIYILKIKNANISSDVSSIFKSGEFALQEALEDLEKHPSLYSSSTYANFNSTSWDILKSLRETVEEYRHKGYKIAFVGAAAKAMTVIHAGEIEPDFFLDESPYKIGLYPVGLKAKILPLSDCKFINEKTLFVITAWNFSQELAKKLRAHSIPDESIIFSYFPKITFL